MYYGQTHLGGRPRNCLNNSFLAEKVNSILHHLHIFEDIDNVLNSEYKLKSQLFFRGLHNG